MRRARPGKGPSGRALRRWLLRLLYWLAVLAISLVLLVSLVLFFESRDESSLEGRGGAPEQQRPPGPP